MIQCNPGNSISLTAGTGEGFSREYSCFIAPRRKEINRGTRIGDFIREKEKLNMQRCFDFGVKFLVSDIRPKIRKSKIITMV